MSGGGPWVRRWTPSARAGCEPAAPVSGGRPCFSRPDHPSRCTAAFRAAIRLTFGPRSRRFTENAPRSSGANGAKTHL